MLLPEGLSIVDVANDSGNRASVTIMLSAAFGIRRAAEMTVERLVRDLDLDHVSISITREDDSPPYDTVVTAEVVSEDDAEIVRATFDAFEAQGVVETDYRS